jgi:hypothetical protein
VESNKLMSELLPIFEQRLKEMSNGVLCQANTTSANENIIKAHRN